jgi:hypothetical protein
MFNGIPLRTKKEKVGKRKVVGRSFERKAIAYPIQDELDVNSFVRFADVTGPPVGASYLQQGDLKHRLVFAFKSEGWHPDVSYEEAYAKVTRLSTAMKELRPNETMSFHLGSFVGDQEVQKDLTQLGMASDGNETLQYLIAEEKKLIHRITQKGIRRPKFLYIYATCTYDREIEAKQKQDKVEMLTGAVINVFQSHITNTYYDHLGREIYDFFRSAIDDYQPRLQQFISIKMGLPVTPLSAEEIWRINWERFNSTPCPPLPQLIIFSEKGIEEIVRSDESVKSAIFDNEDSVPIADYRWLYCNGRYTAILTYQAKPKGWETAFDQNRAIWDVIADDEIFDVEVISQISFPSQRDAKDNLDKLTRQGLKKSEHAARTGTIDVAANLQIQEAVEAQVLFLRDDVEISFTTLFLVHRRTLQDLEIACRTLEALCIQTGKVRRETVYPWMTFWQTFPTLKWSKLLVFPFNRQLRCSSNELTGYLPFSLVHTGDYSGLEYISTGGTPIFLDLNNPNRIRRVLFIAKTRGGKSVAVCKAAVDLYARGVTCTVIDSPPSDEASTYKDLVEMLGGAYFDPSTSKINILQPPNLNGLPQAEISIRFDDFKRFRIQMLMRMVIGSPENATQNPVSASAVKVVLIAAFEKFFNTRGIKTRIVKAMKAGLGSQEWDDFPALPEFIRLCTFQQLNLDDANDEMLRATRFVSSRLQSWCDTTIGRSLIEPSSFELTNPLFVMIFRGVSDPEEASILGMAMNSIVNLRTLETSHSVLIVDEFAVLSKYDAICEQLADFSANGAKLGLTMIYATQEPSSLQNCKSSSLIVGAFDTFVIGRLAPPMLEICANFLKVDEEDLRPNTLESYSPNPALGCSYWTIFDGNKTNYVRLFVSDALRAAAGNNPAEANQRRSLMRKYGDDRVAALAEYVIKIQEAAQISPV